MRSVLLTETIAPDYRVGLFRHLREKYGDGLQLAFGEVSFSRTLRTSPQAQGLYVRLDNRFHWGRRLLWQRGLLSLAVPADLVIAEFNLRAPSTWWMLWRRTLAGKPTVFWGHNTGRGRWSKPLRRWMLRRAAGFIAYMPSEQRRLQSDFPGLPVWVAPNAMMWARDCFFIPRAPDDVRDIIYVGRLVATKKVRLLLQGFLIAVQAKLLPSESRLIYVGDGPERDALQQSAAAAGADERVVFTGHVSDIATLRGWYATAIVAVSPGYVGLSATQAFSFGVPMLVADNEPHSPEIELCEKGRNTQFFRANDATSLADALGEMMREKRMWISRRDAICSHTRNSYTFDQMAGAFERVLTTDFAGD